MSSFGGVLSATKDDKGFTPKTTTTTKTATTTRVKPANQKLGKAAVDFATQKLMKSNNAGKEAMKESDELNTKKMLLGQITDYYSHFPQLAKYSPNKRPPIEKIIIHELEQELAFLQNEVSQPFAMAIVEEITFNILEVLEGAYTKYLARTPFGYLGDIEGLVKEIRAKNKDEFAPEIIEIAIRWKAWLNWGPYARLLSKIAQKATERRIDRVRSMYLNRTTDPKPSNSKTEKEIAEEEEIKMRMQKLKDKYVYNISK